MANAELVVKEPGCSSEKRDSGKLSFITSAVRPSSPVVKYNFVTLKYIIVHIYLPYMYTRV